MDQIIQLFSEKVKSMISEYKNQLELTPEWQINSAIPLEKKTGTLSEKVIYLFEKFQKSNPLFLIIIKDYLKLKTLNEGISANDLPSLNLDPRFLEGMGLKSEQIDTYYKFVNRAKLLLK